MHRIKLVSAHNHPQYELFWIRIFSLYVPALFGNGWLCWLCESQVFRKKEEEKAGEWTKGRTGSSQKKMKYIRKKWTRSHVHKKQMKWWKALDYFIRVVIIVSIMIQMQNNKENTYYLLDQHIRSPRFINGKVSYFIATGDTLSFMRARVYHVGSYEW